MVMKIVFPALFASLSLRTAGGECKYSGPRRPNDISRWRIRRHPGVLQRLQEMDLLTDHYELRRALLRIHPSELTRAQRRVWLLESVRANMLYYASEFEAGALRGSSLSSDGIAPAFSMCKEMRDSILEGVEEIRATYHKNWVRDQLGKQRPESEPEIVTNAVVTSHRHVVAYAVMSNLSRPIWGDP